jgi:ATP-dependent Clp protease ATP-binding subunit ClpC
VIVFHPLSEDHIVQIVDILFRDVLKRIEDRDIKLVLSTEAKRFLAEKGFDEKFGARPLKRAVQRYLEDPFSEALLQGRFTPGDEIVVEVADADRLEFKVRASSPPMQEESIQEEVR